MNEDFLVIPSDGSKPYFIPQCGSISDTWHNLMRDPDRELLFECVSIAAFGVEDLIFMVDECGKLKPHSVNSFASLFYTGTQFGDYLAGTVMVARLGLVKTELAPGEYIEEYDLLPLTEYHVNVFKSLLEVIPF